MIELFQNNPSEKRHLRKATTQELAGMLEKVEVVPAGDIKFDENGYPKIELDDYGHPKNLIMQPDEAIVHSARLGLRARYWDWTASPRERQEAGEALGYTTYRINLHEKTRKLRISLGTLASFFQRPYERCFFNLGRDLINIQD